MPTAGREARKRRREVLHGLLAAAGVTLVLGFGMGGPFYLLHLLVDIALVGYVVMLVRMQKSSAEREMKVTFLPHVNPEAEPARLLKTGGGWQPGAVGETQVR